MTPSHGRDLDVEVLSPGLVGPIGGAGSHQATTLEAPALGVAAGRR